jgi:dihydroneopterin aldolase
MTIHIKALEIDAIIGLLDFERITAQKIIIDLEASYTYTEGVFINYADLALFIETQIIQEKYELLEDALLDLKQTITQTYPTIQNLKLKIIKPNILDKCEVGLSEEWELT